MKRYLILAALCLAGSLQAGKPVALWPLTMTVSVDTRHPILEPLPQKPAWLVHEFSNEFSAAVFLEKLEGWQSACAKVFSRGDKVVVIYPRVPWGQEAK